MVMIGRHWTGLELSRAVMKGHVYEILCEPAHGVTNVIFVREVETASQYNGV